MKKSQFMKILVPVAFEDTSFAAFAYAAQLAKDINAQITLVNVIHVNYDSVNPLGSEYLDALVDGVKSRMDYFINEYPAEKGLDFSGVEIEQEILFGVPSYSIVNMAEEDNYDMIIMGTRDKHGIFDQLLGSTSSNVVTSAMCPVMLIHSNTIYIPLKRVAFAFDSRGKIEKIIKRYADLNNHFKAKTDFIHISNESDSDFEEARKEIERMLIEDLNVDFAFEIKNIESDNIKETIIDYSKISDIDMLAMVHRDRSFLSGLLKPSLSARVAQEYKQPVMVYNEKAEK